MNGVEVASLYAKLGADVSGFDRGLNQMQKGINAFEQVTIGAFRRVGEMAVNTMTAAMDKVNDVVSAGIDFNAMQEQATVAFETMLGSAEHAQSFLNEMQAFARKTPFEYPDLLVASRRLMALGFEANEVLPTLENIGNATAAMGGGQEMIDRVTTALGQMRAKGRVQAEEMMQLTENGIAGWDMLAKHLGVDVAEAMDMVTKRQVDAATGIEAIMNGINERFGGMMSKQATTWEGLVSNLKDSFGMLSGRVMKPFFDVTKRGLEFLVNLLSNDAFNRGIDKFVESITSGLNYVGNVVNHFRNLFSFELTILTSENASFGEKILAVWDMVATTGGKLWQKLIDGLTDLLPEWWNNLGEWGPALWEWIKEAVPKAIETLGKWAGELWQWMLDNGPEWLKVVDQWGRYLWQWLVEVTPIALAKLGEWGNALFGWIAANAPIWWAALKNFGEATWQVISAIGTLLKPIWDAIASFVTWQDVALAAALALTISLWPAIRAGITALAAFVSAWGPVAALFVAGVAAIALFRTAWQENWWNIQERVDSALTSIQARFGPLFNTIKQFGLQALTEIVAWVTGNETQFTAVQKIWDVAKQTFGIIFTEIGMKIKEFGQIAWTWFADNFPKTAALLVAAVETIQKKWNELWAVIGPVVNAIVDKITDLVTRWRNGTLEMGGALDRVKAVFDGVWAIIVRIVTLAASTIMDTLKLVSQLLTGDWAGAWQTAKDIVSNLFVGLVSVVVMALDTILGAFGINTETVRQWGLNFVLAATRVIDVIKTIGKPIVDMLAQFFSWKDVLILIGTAVATALGASFVGAIMAAVSAVGAFFAAWGPVIALMGLMLTAIATLRHAWEQDWGGIQEKTFNVMNQIRNVIRSGLENITTWFKEKSGLWHGSWEKTFEYFAWWMSDGWRQKIWAPLTIWFSEMTRGTVRWANQTILAWREYFSDLSQRWTDFKYDVINKVSGWTNEVRHLIQTWIDTTERKFTGWSNNTENIINSWITQVVWKIRDWKSDVIEWFEKVFAWWKPSEWLQMGKDIVDGLRRGMEQAWNTLKSWWDGVWGKDLTKTVKVKMETHSPSKVMERLGAYVMEGFGIGAEKMLPYVQDVMGAIPSTSMAAGQAAYSGMGSDTPSTPATNTARIEELLVILIQELRNKNMNVTVNQGSGENYGNLVAFTAGLR